VCFFSVGSWILNTVRWISNSEVSIMSDTFSCVCVSLNLGLEAGYLCDRRTVCWGHVDLWRRKQQGLELHMLHLSQSLYE
jgi:hypothetical protein